MTGAAAVPEVTDDTFGTEVLAAPGPVLVDFWAPWCQPCLKLAPVLTELAAQFGDRLRMVRLEVDENPDTTRDYGVTSIPTLMLFRGGEPVATLVGARPKPALAAELAELVP